MATPEGSLVIGHSATTSKATASSPAFTVVLAVVCAAASGAQDNDDNLARTCFAEARRLSDADGGRLWGIPLYGPTMFVDTQSRKIFANQPDAEGQLTEVAGLPGERLFTGRLPDSQNIVNSAIRWAGVEWTMVRWPLPRDEQVRGQLLMHESWHRVQDDLGLPLSSPANVHLDTRNGRIWLTLEWRALARALETADADQKEAIADALTFRAHRRSLFPAAAADENALELNEGLAEYTGLRLSTGSDSHARQVALTAIRRAQKELMFARSFAYTSGPAWGLLLDEHAGDWRKRLKKDSDIVAELQTALTLPLQGSELAAAAMARATAYEGDALIAEETRRDAEKQKILADLRARFVDGPGLRLPMQDVNIAFDPNRVQPLGEMGSVYHGARLTGPWGILTAEGGALVAADWSAAVVPVPRNLSAPPQKGPGWSIELAGGWRAVPDAKTGGWQLEPIK